MFFVCVFYFSIILIKVDINTLLPTIGVFAVAAFRVLPSSSRILSSYNFLNFSLKSIQVIYDEFRNNTSSVDIESFDKSKNIQFEYFDKKPGFLKITELNYTYPKAKKQIINNLSISAKTGEIIGIMGKSGTGKTTLVDLILGILTPNNGEIKYNDVNVFKNLKHWQKLFGYVPQDIYLIDDSIKNNIAYGIEEKKINIKKIYKILESLDLTDFVHNLENSINTTVGERGVKISGGELQRIGIARALYNDPQILILDESTSSLDTLTERKILKLLVRLNNDLLNELCHCKNLQCVLNPEKYF